MATANQVTASAARPAKAAPLMRLVRTKTLKWMIVMVIVPALDILLAPLVVLCARANESDPARWRLQDDAEPRDFFFGLVYSRSATTTTNHCSTPRGCGFPSRWPPSSIGASRRHCGLHGVEPRLHIVS